MKLRQHWFSAVMSAVVFVFLFLPIIVVFKDAFNANKTLLTWGGATFTWFGEALSSGAYLTSLRRTRSGTHDVEAAWQLDDFLKKLRGE